MARDRVLRMTSLVEPARFAAPVERGAVARDWAARGFSCEDFVDPPGRAWRDFVHDVDELVTVVEGRLRLEIGASSVVAGPGDEVFIPRGANHSVFNIDRGMTRWLFGYRRAG
jgi:mannose-6-phosphate isomerase-like protein (cupin superfamily)